MYYIFVTCFLSIHYHFNFDPAWCKISNKENNNNSTDFFSVFISFSIAFIALFKQNKSYLYKASVTVEFSNFRWPVKWWMTGFPITKIYTLLIINSRLKVFLGTFRTAVWIVIWMVISSLAVLLPQHENSISLSKKYFSHSHLFTFIR